MSDRDSSTIVTPAEFDTPQSRAASNTNKQSKSKIPEATHWWHSQFNLMLAVFALLAIAAILLVMVMPSPTLPTVNNTVATTAVKPSAVETQAPWNESQRAAARVESQKVLATLLERKKKLEHKNVQLWAHDQFQEALQLAEAGDSFYKSQQYAEAIKQYQSASEQLNELFGLLPTIIDNYNNSGQQALNEGKSALAKELFNKVLGFESTNEAALEGLNRADNLDQVLSLMASADSRLLSFIESQKLQELLAAEKELKQAQMLDPKYKPVVEKLSQVSGQIADKRFKLAMSKAYQALFANRYTTARSAFAEALKIKPSNKVAMTAMQQALASDTRSSLKTLLVNAKSEETDERWASAQNNYQAVLQRDPNQISAKLGDIRAGARRQLDAQIDDLLTDPLSFSRSEKNKLAVKLLSDAKAIRTKGPKLLQQITQLETALQQSNQSVKVRLISDSLTEVSLQKVGSKAIKLGKFTNKNLALKPGRYIAIGVRLGYQDVRNEIELRSSGNDIKSITIRCEQTISLSSRRSNNG